jgi:hypothetical protein
MPHAGGKYTKPVKGVASRRLHFYFDCPSTNRVPNTTFFLWSLMDALYEPKAEPEMRLLVDEWIPGFASVVEKEELGMTPMDFWRSRRIEWLEFKGNEWILKYNNWSWAQTVAADHMHNYGIVPKDLLVAAIQNKGMRLHSLFSIGDDDSRNGSVINCMRPLLDGLVPPSLETWFWLNMQDCRFSIPAMKELMQKNHIANRRISIPGTAVDQKFHEEHPHEHLQKVMDNNRGQRLFVRFVTQHGLRGGCIAIRDNKIIKVGNTVLFDDEIEHMQIIQEIFLVHAMPSKKRRHSM